MIVVDVETTGLDPERHAIVAIGAVNFHSPDQTFYAECQPWDGAEIEDKALEVNGFTREQLADPDRLHWSDAIEQFNEWAIRSWADRVLANHNVAFDVGFLQAAYRRRLLRWPFGYKTVDLHAVAYLARLGDLRNPPPMKRDGTSALDLDGILTWLGMEPEPRPHNALMGARCAAECLRRLRGMFKE